MVVVIVDYFVDGVLFDNSQITEQIAQQTFKVASSVENRRKTHISAGEGGFNFIHLDSQAHWRNFTLEKEVEISPFFIHPNTVDKMTKEIEQQLEEHPDKKLTGIIDISSCHDGKCQLQ